MTDLVRTFRAVSESLSFNPTETEQFLDDIQAEIETSPPDEALELATIKLEAARRLYWELKR